MEITLDAELEAAVKLEAGRRGLAPEALAVEALRERFKDALALSQPRDEWERRLRSIARDCGVSLPDLALSSEGLYD
jgi:hypothetical protein